MKYQVGDLIDFDDSDPIFDTLDEAQTHALKKSEEYESEYFGIWTYDGNADLVAIVHQERIYTP